MRSCSTARKPRPAFGFGRGSPTADSAASSATRRSELDRPQPIRDEEDMSSEPHEAALRYAGIGWAVFPCHAPADNPPRCTCGRPDCSSPAKHPRIAGGLKAATRDHDQISAWWRRWPGANVAIRTGAVSGLVVVDVDPRHGGAASLDALLREFGPALDTLRVDTGGGGVHLYFRHPGLPVHNDAGRKLGVGVDVRGDGGYVIAPPSLHYTGARYRIDATRAIADLPSSLWRRVLRAPRPPTQTPAAEISDRWAAAAVRAEVASVRQAKAGQRNNTLVRAAFKLGQIVESGRIDEAQLCTSLLQAATAAGLPANEALATIGSGMWAGRNHPRRPAPAFRSGPDGHALSR
jgi:hypothetical protein